MSRDAERGSSGWRRWLGRLVPETHRAEVLQELDDLAARRASAGRSGGPGWYLRQVMGFAVRLRGPRIRRAVVAAPASLLRDVRLAVRMLARRRGYALSVILTLGVGLGGVATVYNAANWVLLRPVPGVSDGEGLATIRLEQGEGSPSFPVSFPDLETLGAEVPALRALEGAAPADLHLEIPGESAPRRVVGAFVTSGWTELLGLGATLGSAAPREGIVVSHRLWRELWAGAPRAIGASVLVNGIPLVVEGVAPRGYLGPELPGDTDVWLSAEFLPRVDPQAAEDVLSRRDVSVVSSMVGRLAPGADPALVAEQGQAGMDHVRERFTRHSFFANYTLRAYPGLGLSPWVRADVRRTLGLLGATSLVLLLLSMANVTNLGVAHGASRQASAAVHRALGASRIALGRRALVEHALLGVLGALVGVGVALLGTRLFRRASLSSLGASLDGVRLDGRVLVFTASIALGAALLAGLIPAVTAAGGHLHERLQARRQGGRLLPRLQGSLVLVQVALSVVLLVGAGLMVRTVVNLRSEDLGLEPEGAVRFTLDPALHDYDLAETRRTLESLQAALVGSAGTTAAGFTTPALVQGSYLSAWVWPAGRDGDEDRVVGAQYHVTPGFLAASGMRLLAGRDFRPGDETLESPGRPAVVGRAMLEGLHPGMTPAAALGRQIRVSRSDATIVGVVEDPRTTGLLSENPPVVLLPWGRDFVQAPVTGWVRNIPGDRPSPGMVRSTVAAVVPELPVFDLRTAREQVDILVVEQRVVKRLAVSLALLGLGLAGIGLQGLLAYNVSLRRREIGVRMALGASAERVVGHILRGTMGITVLGGVIGAAGGYAMARAIQSRLYGVQPLDPATYAAAAVALLLVTALGSYAPALRAAGVQPREALAAE